MRSVGSVSRVRSVSNDTREGMRNMYAHSFKELTVWQRSFDLTKIVYQMTTKLPPSEQFGLVSQLRRAAVSIPSNIAEGKHRKTNKDFSQFLHIADGSCAELETQLLLVREIYPTISVNEALSLLNEVQRMLGAMLVQLSRQR